MKQNFSKLSILFVSLFLLASCNNSSLSAKTQQTEFPADKDYFLGLRLLEENKQNEAIIKFKNCMKKGSYHCAKRSAQELTRIGSVQDKNKACEELIKKFDDEECKLIAAAQFSSADEITKLLKVTENLNLSEADNELIHFRMKALVKRNNSHLKDEVIEWFTTRQISSEHYKFYRDQLRQFTLSPLSQNDSLNQLSLSPLSQFSPEVKSLLSYRIDLYKKDYHKAFEQAPVFFEYFENGSLEPYGQLVSDIGKAYLYGNDKYYENAIIFQELANQYKDTPAEFYFWFYAARLFVRAQNYNSQAISCFEKSIACSTTTKQKDNALWYLLDAKITDSYKSTIKDLETYASLWTDPDYFDDFFENLIMQLTVSGEWDLFPILFDQIDGYASKETTAKIAYICARLIQEDNIHTNKKDTKNKIDLYLQRAQNSGTAAYYKLLSAWQQELTEPEVKNLILSPITQEEIPVDYAAENLLKGYVEFGFPEKVYPEWLNFYKKGISTDVSMYLADFLYKCRRENPDYQTLSIRIAARSANISQRPLTKEELKLVYPQDFCDFVNTYSQKYNLEPAVVYALIRSESFFDPDVESTAGAIGLTQLMQLTSDDIARKLQIEDYTLTDPETNINFGTYYLSELYERCDKKILQAFFSYNAGITRVRRWLNSSMIEFGEKKNMPGDLFLETVPFAETREYGRKLISASIMYKWLYQDEAEIIPYKTIVENYLY